MGATLGRLIADYQALVQTCRARADELELSRAEIDRLGGLPAGYAGKLLGKDGCGPRQKKMWPVALESMLGTLGLRILLIEDQAATALTLALRTPVNCSQQRFGNTCNSKRSTKVERIDKVEAIKLIARQNAERPVSRAHLRVVQTKRRGGKYG